MKKLQVANYELRAKEGRCGSQHILESPQGFMVLTAVLLAGAVTSVIATSLIMMSVLSAQGSFSTEQANEAISASGYCAETALRQIYADPAFTVASPGTTLSIGSNSCNYIVTGAAPTKTITATGTAGTVVKKTQVVTSAVTPVITISSWNELP